MQGLPAVGPVLPLLQAVIGLAAIIGWAAFGAVNIYRKFSPPPEKLAVSAAPALRDILADAFDGFRQHTDLVLTQHFDQLRRDLTTIIERAHERTQDQNTDAMSRFLLDLEIFVKEALERRRNPR